MSIDPQWAARVATAMGRMAEVFDVPLTTERVDAYVEALADVPAESLEIASKALIRGSKWFPRPVEWRRVAEMAEKLLEDQRQQRRNDQHQLALEAYYEHNPRPICTDEENLVRIRAIQEQFRYVVSSRPLEDRPHNRDSVPVERESTS